MKKERNFTKEPVDVLYLLFQNNRVARLRTLDTYRLKEAIEETMKVKELTLEENSVFLEFIASN